MESFQVIDNASRIAIDISTDGENRDPAIVNTDALKNRSRHLVVNVADMVSNAAKSEIPFCSSANH